jgi:branched-chain amino acid transport system ATP-binding protein
MSGENAMTQQTQAGAPSNANAKNPVLEVRDLCVSYGKVEALTNASLTVGEGQIVTVIGPNGAGKTTMLSAIMGVLGSHGRIAFDGSVEGVPEVERMVARGMTLVPEKRELFGEMSVEDNLVLGAFQRYRMGKRDHAQTLEEVYALFPRLKERRDQAAGTMSGGERQMLAVGRALMAKPKLLMLDEPSLGLAPLITREIFRIITELRRRGVSILLVEQNARAALQVADYAYVLETGQVAMQGPAHELADDPRVIEAYLGLGGKHQAMLST